MPWISSKAENLTKGVKINMQYITLLKKIPINASVLELA